jgi:hypothetical protein
MLTTSNCYLVEPPCFSLYTNYLLKVPKREIFLTELNILSYPIWTGDLGTKAKNGFV